MLSYCLTLCAVTANCSALFIMSAVLSSARPNRSPRSFSAWLAFCTALVTLSAAVCSMLLPADKGWEKRRRNRPTRSQEKCQTNKEKRQRRNEIGIPLMDFVKPLVTNEPVTSDSLICDPEHENINGLNQVQYGANKFSSKPIGINLSKLQSKEQQTHAVP